MNTQILETAKTIRNDLALKQRLLGVESDKIRSELTRVQTDTEAMRSRLTYLHISEKILQDVVEKVSVQNLARIETAVNRALSFIFRDLGLTFKVVTDVKRGNNVYRFELLRQGVSGTIHSFGGGIIAAVSVVLKLLFNVITKRWPLLVLDETLSFLAVAYIPAMSEFLTTMSTEFDIPILMVTHQPEFAAGAQHCYEVSFRNDSETILTPIQG